MADETPLDVVVSQLQADARATAYNGATIIARLHLSAVMAIRAGATREGFVELAAMAYDETKKIVDKSIAEQMAKLPEFARPPVAPAPAAESEPSK
jgi:hypothetical protein